VTDFVSLGTAVLAARFAGETERAEGGKDFSHLFGIAAGELFGDLGRFERRGRGGEGFLHDFGSLAAFFGPVNPSLKSLVFPMSGVFFRPLLRNLLLQTLVAFPRCVTH
jgi:hypothetical protein